MTKIAASQRQEVASLCIAGATRGETAMRYGVTEACIAAILRGLGVKLRAVRPGRKGRTDEKKASMAEAYRSGKTQAEIAADYGISVGRVCQILKGIGVTKTDRPKAGPGRVGKWKRIVSPDAYPSMAEMYKSGKSLEEVGAKYGITRERARQILTAHGIGRMDGGATIKCFTAINDKIDAAKAQNERTEARIRKTWGFSLADYTAHVAEYGASSDSDSPMGRYAQHRKNARQRGLGWNFTFAEWWRVWLESGKWGERGRGKQGYVMARWGDGQVPYSVNTVYICTSAQNIKDGYIVSPSAERTAKARITRAQKSTGATA